MPRKPKVQPGDPRKVVAYLRWSTDKQDLSGEAQLAAIRAWAERTGAEIVGVFEDQVSGGTWWEERLGAGTGLTAAINCIRDATAGALVVLRRDRLARDVGVAAIIDRIVRQAGARVLSTDGIGNEDTHQGEIQRFIDDFQSMCDRRRIRERTREALARKKAMGEHVGRIPRGFEIRDKHLAPVAGSEGVRATQRARELRGQGMTYLQIARVLEREGHRPERGRRIWDSSVRRMLSRATAACAA